jgi:hypothetical protein
MLLNLDAIFDPDRNRRCRTALATPADLPADWHLVWDERAAIMEFEGGFPRERAEHLALLNVMDEIRRTGTAPPHWVCNSDHG